MKQLVILRHGKYLSGTPPSYPGDPILEELSPEGKRQYEKLALDISQVTLGGSTYILTSPAPRAVDGANILAAKLPIVSPVERLIFLWDATDIPENWEGKKLTWDDAYTYLSDNSRNSANDRLEQILHERADKAEVLVLISHKDLCSQFTSYYTKKHFGRAVGRSFEYGEGVHLDIDKRDCYLLPL